MTVIEFAKPNAFEQLLVLVAQAIFWNLFFVIYVLFPRTAHRIVGYFEEVKFAFSDVILHEKNLRPGAGLEPVEADIRSRPYH